MDIVVVGCRGFEPPESSSSARLGHPVHHRAQLPADRPPVQNRVNLPALPTELQSQGTSSLWLRMDSNHRHGPFHGMIGVCCKRFFVVGAGFEPATCCL